MAYDRFSDDDDQIRDIDRSQDRPRDRDRDRDRGFFRGGRDDRGPSRDDRPRSSGSRGAAIPYDETRDLIASSKVEGTPVYGSDDSRLGTVKALMIDKIHGQVRYAVLSHGTGFLGLDEEVVPVRWEELRYDERRQGYRVDFTAEDVAFTLENRRRGRLHGRNLDENRR